MDYTTRFRIAADHPALPGHFPGRPVVPGVVLLDRVAAALEDWCGADIAALPQAKFVSPLLPEQDADLSLHEDGARIRFEIASAGRLVASGVVETGAVAR